VFLGTIKLKLIYKEYRKQYRNAPKSTDLNVKSRMLFLGHNPQAPTVGRGMASLLHEIAHKPETRDVLQSSEEKRDASGMLEHSR